MSLKAEVLDALLAAGATAEMIVAAVKADVASEDARVQAKREANAARQRKFKAKRKVTPDNARNALPSVTNAGNATPPNENISNPPDPPVEADASTAPKGRVERGFKIPIDWEPPTIAELSPEARALAEKWPAAAYRAEAEAFRNYWLAETGKAARKSDWNRAWANRIVAVNGKVMRQAKFAEPSVVGRASKATMNSTQLRSAIAYAEDNGDPDRAADLKRQLAELQRCSTGPPQPIGNLVAKAANGIRITQ
jgi:hypothetical protein